MESKGAKEITSKLEEMRKLSQEHRFNPKPGDYWHECFTPILVVLEVSKSAVVICDQKMDAGNDRWSWDLSQIKACLKTDFAKRLTYGGLGNCSEDMKDITWCDVAPEAHKDVVEYWLSMPEKDDTG